MRDWAGTRRARWSAPRIALAVLVHVLVLLALRLAVDRVQLPRAARERLTALVDVTLHVAPPPPALALHPLPSPARTPSPTPSPARAPAPARAAPHEDVPAIRVPATPPEPLAITAAPPASSPLPPRDFLDSAATRQAIRDAAHGTLQTRAREQVQEDPGSELVAADGSHAGDTRHVTPTPAQALQQGVAAARKGDCMKGEYAGGGAGLLSVPFLLANAALGKCSPH